MNSGQFTFYIGKTKKPFLVHAAAIADHSPALSALVYGPMLEANTQSVTLNDMAEADFIRFCQFVYAGDYTPPPPALVEAATITTRSGWANTNRRDDFMEGLKIYLGYAKTYHDKIYPKQPCLVKSLLLRLY